MTKPFHRYFTEQEERQLFFTIKQHFASIHAQRDYYWMKLSRATGIRLTVLSGLTVHDARVALEEDYLRVRGEINKRGKEQELFLVKTAREALQNLLRIHKLMCVGISWDINETDRPLILSRNHRGMSDRNFQSRMNKWCELAGLKGSPHWLRHTWAKRALKNSTAPDPLQRIQLVLGHDDMRTTHIYTQPDKEDLKEIMRDAN